MAEIGKKIVSKRVKIDKANATVLSFIAVSAFLVIFSLVTTKYLISQFSYQVRVQSAQHKSLVGLQADKVSAAALVRSYEKFNGQTTNLIGGSSTQQGGQNGDNAKIVLDALPSSYDFPSLITSVQALINLTGGIIVDSIGGSDTGAGNTTPTTTATTTTPPPVATTGPSTPVAMPFSFTVSGSYQQLQQVIINFQNSIRPMQILSLNFSGSDNDMSLTVSAQSYYLPASGFNIKTEDVQ